MEGFAAQLAQGELYPRWLLDGNFGGGSAAFYYYAPLPFYITAIPGLLFPESTLSSQLAWGEWILIALSGIAFLLYARERFALSVAVVGAAIYMALPYHFEVNLWQRQDIGEIANYIWMPLILLYTDRIFDARRGVVGLAVSYALLLLSHLPSALLFSICLGGYVLALMRDRASVRPLARFAASIMIGLMLSAVYWIPALFSLHYVRAAEGLWSLPQFDFHIWFFPLQEALREFPPRYVLAERLFALACAVTVIFLICWLVPWRQRRAIGIRKMLACLTMLAIAWFLMTPLSTFIWETAPALSRVQFPWRLLSVVELAAAVAVLYALHCAYTLRDLISSGAVLFAIGLLVWCFATGTFSDDLGDWRTPQVITIREDFVRDRGEAREYLTQWSTPESVLEVRGQPRIVSHASAGTVTVAEWAPRDIGLAVRTNRPSRVVVRQFYFPNWRARTDAGTALSISPSASNGLIVIDLPAGTYNVGLQLTLLPQEWIGIATTSFAMFVLLVIRSSSARPIRAFLSGLRTPAAVLQHR